MKQYLIFSKADPKYRYNRAYLAEIELIKNSDYPIFKATQTVYSNDIPEGSIPQERIIPEYNNKGELTFSVKLLKCYQKIIECQPCFIKKIIAHAGSRNTYYDDQNYSKMINNINYLMPKIRVYNKLTKDDEKYYGKRINNKEEFLFPKIFTENNSPYYFSSKNDKTAFDYFRKIMKKTSLSNEHMRVSSFGAMAYSYVFNRGYFLYNPYAKNSLNLKSAINRSFEKINNVNYQLLSWTSHNHVNLDTETFVPNKIINVFDDDYSSSIAIVNPILKQYFLGFDALYKKDWKKVKKYFGSENIGSAIQYDEFFDIYPIPLSDIYSFIGSYFYEKLDLKKNFPDITDEEFITDPRWQILVNGHEDMFMSNCGSLFSDKFKFYEVKKSGKKGSIKSFSNRIHGQIEREKKNNWKKNQIFNIKKGD